MKRFLLAACAVLAIAGAANAQKAELQLGYGGFTQMDAMDMHDGWAGVNNAWGGVTAALNFRVLPNLSVGPSYTFSSTTTKGGPEKSKIAYHVIMLNARYNYYRTPIFTLYAHMGLGVDISHMQPRIGDSYNRGYCAFQLSPIGASVGINNFLSMYGELGFGAQGLLQVGLRLNL